MRILVIRNAYDKDMGGAEQYALNLCKSLQDNNLDVLLMTRVPKLIAKAKAARIQVKKGIWHSSQEWGKHYFIRFPLMVIWYWFVILKEKIDVVHPMGRDDFIFATFAARLLGRRVVWTDHADLKVVLDTQKHPFPHLRSWIVWAARYTHVITCTGEVEQQAIKAVAPPEIMKKIVVVRNGVFPPDRLQPVEKDAQYVIVANSRLVRDKGIKELITGFAHSTYVQQSKLWIVGGESNNLEYYQKLAQDLKIAAKVRFVGYVNDPNNYVASADVFIHASYHEAFSLAIIEAAMLGRPIIATRVGGASEILTKDSGILIPPKDHKAITDALDSLLANPKKRALLSKNVQSLAHAEFDFSEIVKKKIIPLYGA